MSWRHSLRLVLWGVVVVGGIATAQAQIDRSQAIDDYANLPPLGERVVFYGIVGDRVNDPAATTMVYRLRDKYGVERNVRGALPVDDNEKKTMQGTHYWVEGTVMQDPSSPNPMISELRRERLEQPTPPPGNQVPPPPDDGGSDSLRIAVGAGALILGVLLVVLVIFLPRLAAAGGQVVVKKGQTIAMAVPNDSALAERTMVLLPGSLEVLSGDSELTEIPLYKRPQTAESEFRIGRLPENARPTLGILAFQHQTVSAKHAKLVFAGGKWTLINYSTTNPTRVNGSEMQRDGSRELVDGDIIDVGVVKIRFHARR